MATFYRADGWVKSVLGQAIAGASVYICLQPTDAAYVPPVPLASVFSDPAGLSPITQPIITDGFGHFDYYAASGVPYTEVVVNAGKIQKVYQDQVPMGATLGSVGTGTVTNTSGPLIAGQLIIGNGGSDIMTGPPFPGDPTMFLNGTGVFSVPAGGGGGAVSSVFGRTGAVSSQLGDYNFSLISGALALGQIPAGGSSSTFLRGDGVWATPASGSGTVTSVAAGTGLSASPSPIIASGTISLSNTAVTPGVYTNTNLTVNAQGQITAAANGSGGGGSGALILLEEHTASNSASLNFTTSITGTYDEYLVEFINVTPATGTPNIVLQVSTNGGSSYDSSASYAWAGYRASSGGSANAGSNLNTSIFLDCNSTVTSSSTHGGMCGSLRIFNPLSGTMYTRFKGEMGTDDGSSNLCIASMIAGVYMSVTAVNAFTVFANGGNNLASGTIRVYGLTH